MNLFNLTDSTAASCRHDHRAGRICLLGTTLVLYIQNRIHSCFTVLVEGAVFFYEFLFCVVKQDAKILYWSRVNLLAIKSLKANPKPMTELESNI